VVCALAPGSTTSITGWKRSARSSSRPAAVAVLRDDDRLHAEIVDGIWRARGRIGARRPPAGPYG
jgi:hypothetical protein